LRNIKTEMTESFLEAVHLQNINNKHKKYHQLKIIHTLTNILKKYWF